MDLNPRERISDNFTWAEMLASQHRDPVILREQQNPPDGIRANLARFCVTLLEPVRTLTGRLRISSGYRSPPLNEAVGGSKTSAHMAGQAADVHPLDMGLVESYEAIAAADLWSLDQLILEYGSWIHVGGTYAGKPARHELLMIFEPGKYEKWNPADPRVQKLREFR